jgi:alpha-amylase
MTDVCLYFQVHQPYRLRPYRLFDIGSGADYFDDALNGSIIRRVADKCYLPSNRLLADLIRRSNGEFRIALSLSGVVLEQLAACAPDALDSFRALVATGGVELLGETYYHSLASLADGEEFEDQVARHGDALAHYFGRRPSVFRNTELVYNDDIGRAVARLGFRAALVEGAPRALGWRSPNYVYGAASAPELRLLPRNFRLSDDVGFRFSNREWSGWPLTAERYAAWLAAATGDSVHVFLDYETFGEHQWADTGIFAFLEHLPSACAQRGLAFVHPSTLAARPPVDALSFPVATSWADEERDLTAWLGNSIQQAAYERLYGLGRRLRRHGTAERLATWRRLTTSDHLYYMCTKWFADGDVHKYFSPYDTPYDAFITLMNTLQDMEQQLDQPAEHSLAVEWPAIAEMACVA